MTGLKSSASFATLTRAVAAITSPALLVLLVMAIEGILQPDILLYAYGIIVVATTFLLRPFFANIGMLTTYVNDLAEDKQVMEPETGSLGAMGVLSHALIRLHQSWEKKKQQMGNIITEREILVDSLPDILIMCNDDQVIVRTNKAARAIFGQNLANKPLSAVIPHDALLNGVSAVIEELRGREVEFRLTDPVPRDFRAIIERFPIASSGGITMIHHAQRRDRTQARGEDARRFRGQRQPRDTHAACQHQGVHRDAARSCQGKTRAPVKSS